MLLSLLLPLAYAAEPAGSIEDALAAWAESAPVVVRVTVVSVDSREVRHAPGIVSDVVIRVDRVYRDETDTLSDEDLFDLTVPGGEIGDRGVLTSAAPVFHEGDEGILQLRETADGELWPARGNDALLRARDGRLDICFAPTPDEIGLCAEDGRIVLPGAPTATPTSTPFDLDAIDQVPF